MKFAKKTIRLETVRSLAFTVSGACNCPCLSMNMIRNVMMVY